MSEREREREKKNREGRDRGTDGRREGRSECFLIAKRYDLQLWLHSSYCSVGRQFHKDQKDRMIECRMGTQWQFNGYTTSFWHDTKWPILCWCATATRSRPLTDFYYTNTTLTATKVKNQETVSKIVIGFTQDIRDSGVALRIEENTDTLFSVDDHRRRATFFWLSACRLCISLSLAVVIVISAFRHVLLKCCSESVASDRCRSSNADNRYRDERSRRRTSKPVGHEISAFVQ